MPVPDNKNQDKYIQLFSAHILLKIFTFAY